MLEPAIAACPDPDRAAGNLVRLADSAGGRLALFSALIESPQLRDALLRVLSHSQVFADVLVASPEWLDLLRDAHPTALQREDLTRQALQATRAMPTRLSRRNALRRFRKRTLLRIGAADVLDLWPFETVVLGISYLADACLAACVELVRSELAETYGVPRAEDGSEVPFAVIALGKLGSLELNYASDVDVLFVSGGAGRTDGTRRADASEYFDRLARGLSEAMSEPLEEGFLFRVDTRLRPEGRAGPLVRSLESCRLYYESYGRAWERQALLRARVAAGDRALGEEFVAATRPFVFGKRLGSDDLRTLLLLKEQHEERVRLDPLGRWDVKQAPGGIRDVEYATQILQLVLGAAGEPPIRSSTLEALGDLQRLGALTASEARDLRDGYVLARRAEHAVQIRDQFQTHRLPADDDERAILARRLGFPDLESFDRTREGCAQRVRSAFEAVAAVGGWQGSPRRSPLERWIEADREAVRQSFAPGAEDELAALGFRQASRALERLGRMSEPGEPLEPDPRQALARVAETVCVEAAHSGDADASLEGLEALAGLLGARQRLYSLLADAPHVARLLAALAGRSPFLAGWLARSPELLDGLLDPALLDTPRSREEHEAQLVRFAGRPLEALAPILCRMRRRELLRIGLRDITDAAPMHGTAAELGALAEALVEVGLRSALSEVGLQDARVGAIALGSFGGHELHFRSDLDLVIAHDEPDSTRAELAGRAVQRLLRAFEQTRPEGRLPELDTRLRPEGQGGALVPSLIAVAAYNADRARSWERVVATRARPVAGDADVANRLAELAHELAYGEEFGATERAELAGIRDRVDEHRDHSDRERLDLKLCRGGLLELDLLVRMAQIEAGRRVTSVRAPGLREAIRLLARAGLASPVRSESLSAALRLLRGVAVRVQIVREEAGMLQMNEESLAVMGRKLPREVSDRTLGPEEFRERIESARAVVRSAYEHVVEDGLRALR